MSVKRTAPLGLVVGVALGVAGPAWAQQPPQPLSGSLGALSEEALRDTWYLNRLPRTTLTVEEVLTYLGQQLEGVDVLTGPRESRSPYPNPYDSQFRESIGCTFDLGPLSPVVEVVEPVPPPVAPWLADLRLAGTVGVGSEQIGLLELRAERVTVRKGDQVEWSGSAFSVVDIAERGLVLELEGERWWIPARFGGGAEGSRFGDEGQRNHGVPG